MATVSLAPRTTSNESIATHCASTMPPHFTHSSPLPLCPPPLPTIDSVPLVLKLSIFPPLGLHKEILNSSYFLIPLITPETQGCYTVFVPRPHFFEESQEQSYTIAVNPEVITYVPQTTLLHRKTK